MVFSDSSKKRTNKFVCSTVRQKNAFFPSFFGRIRGYQKSFRNYLTFKTIYFLKWCLIFDDSTKKLSNFVFLSWKLNHSFYHIVEREAHSERVAKKLATNNRNFLHDYCKILANTSLARFCSIAWPQSNSIDCEIAG